MEAYSFYDGLKSVLGKSRGHPKDDPDDTHDWDWIREKTVESKKFGDIVFITDKSAGLGSGSSVCYFFKKEGMQPMSGEEVLLLMDELFPIKTSLRIGDIYEKTHIGKEHGFQLSFYPPNTHRSFDIARPTVANDIERSFDEIPAGIARHEYGDFQPIVHPDYFTSKVKELIST